MRNSPLEGPSGYQKDTETHTQKKPKVSLERRRKPSTNLLFITSLSLSSPTENPGTKQITRLEVKEQNSLADGCSLTVSWLFPHIYASVLTL